METQFRFGFMKSESVYILTKYSKILKPITGVLRLCFVTIKGTLKLSFRSEIQKLNATIPPISTSVLLLAFITKSVTFQQRKDSNKSNFMTLNCFLIIYYWSDLSYYWYPIVSQTPNHSWSIIPMANVQQAWQF